MSDMPEFKPLPDTVDVGRWVTGPDDISKLVGIWAGSRPIYPVDSRTAVDAWHQPIVVVGTNIVWHGTPTKRSDQAEATAVAALTSKMRQLFTSTALTLGTVIG